MTTPIEQCLRFLQQLFPTDIDGYLVLWTSPPNAQSLFYRAANLEIAAQRAVDLSVDSNVYFGVGTQKARLPSPRRGGNTSVGALPAVWLDIDTRVPGGRTNLPSSQEEARDWLEQLDNPPSMVVDSGRGLHAYWILDTPLSPPGSIRWFQAGVLAPLAARQGWSFDDTSDSARVLRLPGTLNHKTEPPAPVELLYCIDDRRYSLEQLRQRTQTYTLAPETHWTLLEQGVGEGARNEALLKLAGRDAGPRHLTEEQCQSHLLEWNLLNRPPLDEEIVLKAIHTIYVKEATKAARANLVRTDTGNAERFVADHQDDIRFIDYPWSRWAAWTGQRWNTHGLLEVRRRAKQTVRGMYKLAQHLPSEHQEGWYKWCCSSENAARLKAMITTAESEEVIGIHPEAFDANPYLLGVANGAVDLITGEFHAPQRGDYLTKLCTVEYDPDARCPRWIQFLEEIIPSPAVRDYLGRIVGYTLTGSVAEQCIFFLYGHGANGKTTFLTTIQSILGPYATQLPPEFLLTQSTRDHPTEIAQLMGVRMAVSVEPRFGQHLDDSRVKWLTGGDRRKGRLMREDYFEYMPTDKLWLAANDKPTVDATGDALWRRMRLIPFVVTIPPENQDTTLPAVLQSEASGILNWAIEGCLRWQDQGLEVPVEVTAATRAYRQENDPLGTFLNQCCVLDSQYWIPTGILLEAYNDWCVREEVSPLHKNAFGRELSARWNVGRGQKHIDGTCTGVRLGIQLKEMIE